MSKSELSPEAAPFLTEEIHDLGQRAVHGTQTNPLPGGGFEIIGKQIRRVLVNGVPKYETPAGLINRPVGGGLEYDQIPAHTGEWAEDPEELLRGQST